MWPSPGMVTSLNSQIGGAGPRELTRITSLAERANPALIQHVGETKAAGEPASVKSPGRTYRRSFWRVGENARSTYRLPFGSRSPKRPNGGRWLPLEPGTLGSHEKPANCPLWENTSSYTRRLWSSNSPINSSADATVRRSSIHSLEPLALRRSLKQ